MPQIKDLVDAALMGDASLGELVKIMSELDFKTLAKLGNALARRTGNVVTFVNNVVVNYSNVCVARCPICAFYRLPGRNGSYTRSPEEIARTVTEARTRFGVTELHINGGFNPELGIEYFEEVFRAVKRAVPDVYIKGLTMAEVDYYSRRWRMSPRELLDRLRAAGLDAIAGGGAEIFSEEVRRVVSPLKLSGEEWLRLAELAHSMGIPSNATMLYGHVEEPRHIVEHLLKIREVQERTRGFKLFIPVKFVPWNTELYRSGKVSGPAPSTLDVKVIAMARIVLRDLVKVGAYWLSTGKRMSGVLILAGADDLVGTMINEEVLHSAGAGEYATVNELAHMVREVGLEPAERDTMHRILRML